MNEYRDCMDEVRQKAFEIGGLEDGSYHLEDDELEYLIRLALSKQTEQQPVAWALVDQNGMLRLLHRTETASRSAELQWLEAYSGCSHVPLYASQEK